MLEQHYVSEVVAASDMQGGKQPRRANETRGQMIAELRDGIRKLLGRLGAQSSGHEVQRKG